MILTGVWFDLSTLVTHSIMFCPKTWEYCHDCVILPSTSFQSLASSHSHDTRRSSCDYFISKEIANSPTSFSFTAIKHWNSLPPCLKQIQKFGIFKTRLKQLLLSSDWFLTCYDSFSRLSQNFFLVILLIVWIVCYGPHRKKVIWLNGLSLDLFASTVVLCKILVNKI